MAAPPLLLLQDIALTLGGTPLLDGADLSVAPGERLCLVGRNGSGKSTLLKIAAGSIEADGGARFLQPGAQPPLSAAGARSLRLRHHARLCRRRARADRRPVRGARFCWRARPDRRGRTRAASRAAKARRAALARVLAPEPDILLLDEPTNHLDLPAIEWLEERARGPALGARRSSATTAAFWRICRAPRCGSIAARRAALTRGFGDFEAWRDRCSRRKRQQRHKLDRKIVSEEHWLRYGVTGRRKRNVAPPGAAAATAQRAARAASRRRAT